MKQWETLSVYYYNALDVFVRFFEFGNRVVLYQFPVVLDCFSDEEQVASLVFGFVRRNSHEGTTFWQFVSHARVIGIGVTRR